MLDKEVIMSNFEEAKKRFVDALLELDRIRPIKFCAVDDGDTVMNFKDIVESESDNKIYIEVQMYSDDLPSHNQQSTNHIANALSAMSGE